MISYETAFWTEKKFKMAAIIDQNHVTKHFKMMMFFNFCVSMHVYSTEGF